MPKQTLPTVAEIRASKTLGHGSCSVYAECYTDAEVQKEIDRFAASTRGSVFRAMERHNTATLRTMAEREGS